MRRPKSGRQNFKADHSSASTELRGRSACQMDSGCRADERPFDCEKWFAVFSSDESRKFEVVAGRGSRISGEHRISPSTSKTVPGSSGRGKAGRRVTVREKDRATFEGLRRERANSRICGRPLLARAFYSSIGRLHAYVRPIVAPAHGRWPRWFPLREFQTRWRPESGQGEFRGFTRIGSIIPSTRSCKFARSVFWRFLFSARLSDWPYS
jgi:hypothetical protein